MADCPECGAPLDSTQAACSKCGAAVEATASFEPVEVEQKDAGAGPMVGLRGPALYVQKGHGAGERFLIDRPRLTIGRDPSSDIFLNDVTVSREHATIEVVGDDVVIRDSGSLNGTYVNDRTAESAILQDGDVVQIGTFCMVFVGKKGSAPR
jgi:hypothetical protein